MSCEIFRLSPFGIHVSMDGHKWPQIIGAWRYRDVIRSSKALAFGEKQSSGVILGVCLSSFPIKWERYGIIVKTTDKACKMQTLHIFSKW